MLKKYSIFMMLLLATGSLIGISSIYQPANVETQLRSQLPGLGITQPPGVAGTTQLPRDQQQFLNQAMSDKQLLDRLMPSIINRLDSKMLAQKILPHLKVTVPIGDSYGPLVEVKKEGLPPESLHYAEARCPPGTRVVGGGGDLSPNSYKHGDSRIIMMQPVPFERFTLTAKMDWPGTILAYATCVGAEATVSLKQQPQ
jgi:hypothetical protein